MRAEREVGEFGDFLCGAFGEFGMGVEAGAYGGAADGEIVEAVESHGDAAAVAVEQIDVAGKFLAEGKRRGVLEMGAADFYDVGEFLGFGVERVTKFFYGGEETLTRFGGGGDVHGGGEGVVRGLRHVYVVVGVDGLFCAQRAAGDFDGAVGDDFVDVHVGLRAAAGLPDAEGEVVVELAADDFVGGLGD